MKLFHSSLNSDAVNLHNEYMKSCKCTQLYRDTEGGLLNKKNDDDDDRKEEGKGSQGFRNDKSSSSTEKEEVTEVNVCCVRRR